MTARDIDVAVGVGGDTDAIQIGDAFTIARRAFASSEAGDVLSLNNAGNVVGQKTLAPEPYRGVTALAADAEGRLYLTGRACGASGDASCLIRYAADGGFSWEHYLAAVDEEAVSQGGLAPPALAMAQVPDRFGKLGTTLYLGGASFGDRNQTNIDAFASAVNDVTENLDETYKDLDVWQEWLRNWRRREQSLLG